MLDQKKKTTYVEQIIFLQNCVAVFLLQTKRTLIHGTLVTLLSFFLAVTFSFCCEISDSLITCCCLGILQNRKTAIPNQHWHLSIIIKFSIFLMTPNKVHL
jgi:hypothetical protein